MTKRSYEMYITFTKITSKKNQNVWKVQKLKEALTESLKK